MARRRDVIEEIRSKRSRNLKRGRRWTLAHRRYQAVSDAFSLLRSSRSSDRHARIELLRYVPVGLVACLEGYYRSVIRDLIDSGDPFRENAHRLDEVKLDLSTLLRMEKSAVTVGEFVSHLLPISSLADANRHLSTLMDGDYLASVRDSPVITDFPDTLSDVCPTVFADVEETFRLRHVAVHELALKEQPTFARMLPLLDATFYLTMADDTLWELRAPRA